MHRVKNSDWAAFVFAMALFVIGTANAEDTAELIHIFGENPNSGVQPNTELIDGGDTYLYGTTIYGGIEGAGTIYRIHADGTGCEIVHQFQPSKLEGSQPKGLFKGSDGYLYGALAIVDPNQFGAIYKISRDGSNFAILKRFALSEGAYLIRVIQGSDHLLYGCAASGGLNGGGIVFALATDGTGFNVLHSFKSSASDGRLPYSELVEATDGYLYGTTKYGGTFDYGTVFRMQKDGSNYQVLKSFGSFAGDGQKPAARVLVGSDGKLYGTTYYGGAHSTGTIWKMNSDGSSYSVLQSAYVFTFGYYLNTALLEGADGALYGTAFAGGDFVANSGGTVFKLQKNGSGLTVLKNFDPSTTDGYMPASALYQDANGYLYGVTNGTGYINNFSPNAGTIYKLDTSGNNFSVLHHFAYLDGANPYAGVIKGSDGYLYGTTISAGATGNGNIFKVSPDGTDYQILHSFTTPSDGSFPYAPLVEGPDGALYGTTTEGGVGYGNLFRISKDGAQYDILLTFDYVTNGGYPEDALIFDSDGYMYLACGGGPSGQGIVFKFHFLTHQFVLLKDFDGAGGAPYSPSGTPVLAEDGLLYGAAYLGGNNNQGGFYALARDGSSCTFFKLLDGAGAEGFGPSNLMEASDHKLYGSMPYAGAATCGIIFSLNKDGSNFTKLKEYDGIDGSNFSSRLVEGPDGALVGITAGGGAQGYGTVFKMQKDGSAYSVLRDVSYFDGGTAGGPAFVDTDNSVYFVTNFGYVGLSGALIRLRTGVTMNIVQGDGQYALPNSAFLTPLKVRLLDGNNQPLANMNVRFDAPASGASGVFQSLILVSTDSSGYATAPNLVANNTTGSFQVVASLQYDSAPSATFNLNNSANPPPTDIALSSRSVAENAASGATVGSLSATDLNLTDTFTYTLTDTLNYPDNAAFQIGGIGGDRLNTNAVFDYETRSTYQIKIQVTDSASNTFSKVFNISITDVNEAPTSLALDNLRVGENSTIGTAVGNLSATDPDAGDTQTYSLISGTGGADNASFKIFGNVLQTNASFDYETKNSYSIRIQVTDSASNTFEQEFTISITDVNEAPTSLALDNLSVAENSTIGTAVGNLSATDPDAGDTQTYSLISGTGGADNASFKISGNVLQTNASFDYETKNSYSIRIQVADSASNTFDQQFTISITDVNEAPSSLSLDNSSVPENSAIGTTVGNLSAVDPDAGDTQTYSLVSGTGGADNASFTISGNVLQTNASFDYETKNSYSIRVQVTDSASNTIEQQFTISITNVNEAPTAVIAGSWPQSGPMPFPVNFSSTGSSDPDAGDTLTYAWDFGDGASGTGAAPSHTFTTPGTYTVSLTVTDSHGLASSPVTVQVTALGVDPHNNVLQAGTFNVDRAHASQDSLTLSGTIGTSGWPVNFGGSTLNLNINGFAVLGPVTLDPNGRATSGSAPAYSVLVARNTGTFNIVLSKASLAAAIGLANVNASGKVPLTVKFAFSGGGFSFPVSSSGTFDFDYKTVANASSSGRYNPQSSPPASGYFLVTSASAVQSGVLESFTASGNFQALGGGAIVPTGAIEVDVGGATISVPQSSIRVTGNVATYTPALGAVPGLRALTFNSASHTFGVSVGPLAATGIPLASPAAAKTYALNLRLVVPTAGGTQVFLATLNLQRSSPISKTWTK